MLLLMMELRGRFNTKMIKKAQFGTVYFDEMGAFVSIDRDRVTCAVGHARRNEESSASYSRNYFIGRRKTHPHLQTLTRP
jgi:hypothetical protein